MEFKKHFSKLIGLTLALLLLVACSTPQPTPVPPTNTPTPVPPTNTPTLVPPTPTLTPPPTPTLTPIPPTEIPESTVSNELFDSRIGISVTKVETSRDLTTESGVRNANEGYTYVSVHFTVTRIEGVHVVNIFGFGEEKPQLHDSEGQSYALTYGTVQGVRFKDLQDLSSSELIEGAEGVLVFEIPEDRDPAGLDLIYSYQENWDEDSPKKRGEITITLE